MSDVDFGCRAAEPLLCDAEHEAILAIDNGFNLRERVFDLARSWADQYFFTSELICELNEIAMRGIYASAGRYRDRYRAPESLSAPNHRQVPQLVIEMCEYANSRQNDRFHVAAYLLWRTNWIHPFYDGNGRVSRALCHLAILVETGDTWSVPLPELIANDHRKYICGLQIADRSWDGISPHVDDLQSFIAGLYIDHAIFPDNK